MGTTAVLSAKMNLEQRSGSEEGGVLNVVSLDVVSLDVVSLDVVLQGRYCQWAWEGSQDVPR